MITDARQVHPSQQHLPARFLVEAAAHIENRTRDAEQHAYDLVRRIGGDSRHDRLAVGLGALQSAVRNGSLEEVRAVERGIQRAFDAH